ncbi:MAG: hypothetical protein KKD30_03615 [Gammaproteobacteria bacterium]|nr:hypothetical protein [Gammaproteobacteria bacterium]MBU0885295.1 hypothetical protein [Gammaproteobacteria bacterium]MBU1859030.1 hypothetical protein [Gammaproteobacteria bacterium]
MHQQPAPIGFLAIHPPRRLWPSVPVFYSQNLPVTTQQSPQPAKPVTIAPQVSLTT